MLSTTRKTFRIGGSTGITIPQEMTDPNVEEVTMAANDSLLMVDTKGEVPPDKLQEFFRSHIEPEFDSWWQEERKKLAKEKEHESAHQVSIPNLLWQRLYEVSARTKGKREPYAKCIQRNVVQALSEFLDREGRSQHNSVCNSQTGAL